MNAAGSLLSSISPPSLLIWSAAATLACAQLLLAVALAHLARDSRYLYIGLAGALLSAAAAWLANLAPEPLQPLLASLALLGCFAATVAALLKKARAVLDPRRVRDLLAQLDQKEMQLLRRDLERAAARSKTEQTTHRQHEFLAAMSHELRTPLAGIVGLSRMLAASAAAGQFTRDMGTIERFAQQLLRTVDEGLAFVRQEPPPDKPTAALVPMSLLLRDIQVLSTWLAQQKGNSFALINSSPMPEALYFDEQKLRQVVVNLVSNAAKYCENGHISIAVTLETKDGATQLLWVVYDSGRGMDKAEQRCFIEPFAKSTDSTGLGLGLALVRRLVRQLGGKLTIWSERGKGTQIRMRMPVAVADAEELLGMDLSASLPTTPIGGDSVVFASVPATGPGDLPLSGLPAQDLARLGLGTVREYVKLGQITRIEQWAQRLRHEPELSRQTRQLLDRIALAVASIDLQRIEELLDQADAPPSFHE